MHHSSTTKAEFFALYKDKAAIGRRRSMGRQKIEIKKIEDIDARQVCFSKRRSSLCKKASELSILCGAEVAIVVFFPAGKVFSFGHPSVDCVVQRFIARRGGCRLYPRPASQFRVLSSICKTVLCMQYSKLVAQLEAEKKKKKDALEKLVAVPDSGDGRRWWEKGVEEVEAHELEEYRDALEEMRRMVARRCNSLLPVFRRRH